MSTGNTSVAAESSSDPSTFSSSQVPLPRHEQKKRRQVTVACNECRKRKVKCDGLRPSCSPCHARDLSCYYEADPDATPIVALKRKYDQLQQQKQNAEDVLEMLRSRPEQEAIAILHLIRTEDLATALAMIRDGDLLIPSRQMAQETVPNSLPPLRSLVMGASARQWTADSFLPPMEKFLCDPFESSASQRDGKSVSESSASQIDGKSVFDSKSEHATTLPNIVSDHSAPIPRPSASLDQNVRCHSWAPRRRHVSSEQSLYDLRLRDVRASTWTSVVIENGLFARIISTYLTWDHPPWRLFDEDLFVDDLVAGRANHCSTLLVNAILAYGCQNYSAIEPAREALGSFFFVEAKQLWHLEEGKESLACIAASGLLHGLHHCRGKDKIGLTYLVQGVRMARDMGLFRKKTAAQVYDTSQPRMRRGRAAVSWGLYSYVQSHSMYMHREAILSTPPPVPIPEIHLPSRLASFEHQSLADSWHVGKAFQASCKLWVIVGDFLPFYYNGDEPEDVETRSLLGKVSDIWQRLVSWHDSLTAELESSPDALPHILNLHMQYHCVVAELFRPFVGVMPRAPLPSTPTVFPDEQAFESMEHLRRLVYQYVSRYDGPPVSFSMLGGLLCVTYAAIRRLDDIEWKFFFGVSIKFLGEMVDYFPVARFILQGIYQSSSRTGITLPPEALSVFEYFNGSINRVRANDVESSYPVDLDLSRTDLEGARLSNLIKNTGNIVLEDV